MSGYTQEDVRKLVAGSKRANEMKEEIRLILSWVKKQMSEHLSIKEESLWRRREVFRVEIGEIRGSLYYMSFDPRAGLVPENSKAPTYSTFDMLDPSLLPLDFVKPIHDKLPLIMEEVTKRFPDISGKIQQLIDFASY